MKADASIGEFFFNIIPGSLFLFLLKIYGIFDFFKLLSNAGSLGDDVSAVIGIAIFGLLLGFVFQGLTKWARDVLCLNEKIANAVKKENELEYKLILKHLNITNDLFTKNNFSVLKIFYLMDDFLRGDHPAFLPTHFSARFAFWANITIGIMIIILLRIFLKQLFLDGNNFVLLVAMCFSYDMSKRHFQGYYDAMLKSYFMLNNIKYPKPQS
ncbi:MAG TPA: hypothetical protein VG965_01660 [Patescibacteria group bacterium]|nr:hypothetical protein [Patescibacteria group bacterium]